MAIRSARLITCLGFVDQLTTQLGDASSASLFLLTSTDKEYTNINNGWIGIHKKYFSHKKNDKKPVLHLVRKRGLLVTYNRNVSGE